ncbi:MAG TPA: tripartite tricarboxylate transporter substrate-binding protein [Nocardioides sp.]|nr:tripartite tricarboxylate transporter substrate-binding protein [Nocardioides sp.]
MKTPTSRPMRNRAKLLGAALALGPLVAATGCAGDSAASGDGSDFPSRTLTIIAAGDPGGGLDQAARQLQAAMESAGVDQRMTIENNGGGGGNPARAEVLKRPNDGSTVVAESNRVFLNPILGTTDMTVDDFTPLAQLSNDYLVWAVKADSPYESAEQVLDKIGQDPSSVTFGVGTVPSDDQINILKAAKESGVEDLGDLNIVAFQSGGDLNTELLGGHVEVVSTGFSEAASLAESGKIRLLSISAPEEQPGAAEGVPTWKDLGLDFTVDHWRGIFGPADMPGYAVTWWQDNIEKATKTDEWQKQMDNANLTSDFLPSDEFTQRVKEQADEYESLLQEVGLAK